MPRKGEHEDLTGRTFGKLTVKRFSHVDTKKSNNRTTRHYVWECDCECGNTSFVRANNLKSGHTTSCGCYIEQARKAGLRTSHGLSKTRLYKVYTSMKSRCYNPSERSYHSYGGRGITICDEWLHDFKAFYDWAIANGYQGDGKRSIDRIDVDKGYSPDNCRFISMHEQGFNKTTTHYIEVCGERLSIAEAAEKYGLKSKTIYTRVYRGQAPIKDEEI